MSRWDLEEVDLGRQVDVGRRGTWGTSRPQGRQTLEVRTSGNVDYKNINLEVFGSPKNVL